VASGLSVIQRATLDCLRRLALPAGSRILDAPCGTGDLTKALREDGYEAVGVDVQQQAGALLGDAFRAANLEESLPFADGHFDCVVSNEGIEHLENPFRFLRELHRVLRPDGFLMLTTPNTVAVRSRVRFLGAGLFRHGALPLRESKRDPMHHIMLRTLPELRYALVTSGFRLRSIGHTHIKPASLLYCVYVPWIALYTLAALRGILFLAQRDANREIRRALLSAPVLFGENLLVIADKSTAGG
jgi:SAM-dependent methyltransferase